MGPKTRPRDAAGRQLRHLSLDLAQNQKLDGLVAQLGAQLGVGVKGDRLANRLEPLACGGWERPAARAPRRSSPALLHLSAFFLVGLFGLRQGGFGGLPALISLSRAATMRTYAKVAIARISARRPRCSQQVMPGWRRATLQSRPAGLIRRALTGS